MISIFVNLNYNIFRYKRDLKYISCVIYLLVIVTAREKIFDY
jgi:hypothetical protein